MELCPRCKDKWFLMNLSVDGICQPCHIYDNSHASQVFSYRRKWYNLGDIEVVEEILIARVSLHIQVYRVSGLQRQYSDHTVCFMQNIVRMVERL
jgi:hypothetical protein